MSYKLRYIARIVMEAETPLVVGSGDRELTIDRPVIKDTNGLPYIPGTSLAGVIRHSMFGFGLGNFITKEKLNDFFGYQNKNEPEESRGSRVAISSAHLVGKMGQVYDGLLDSEETGEFLDSFLNLPVRQHVSMTHRGVANTKDKGKFNEEVVFKGSRFIFEIEMKRNDESIKAGDEEIFKEMLRVFLHPDFRIGSGSRKGFGRIKIIEVAQTILDLTKEDQKKDYLDHSSCLDTEFKVKTIRTEEPEESRNMLYTLELKPEDFYLFSSGFKSDEADINPVKEKIITWQPDSPTEDGAVISWKKQNPVFSEEMVLIPGTSVKGAISHRLAFNFNKLVHVYADQLPEGDAIENHVGVNNKAVKALYGEASNYAREITGSEGFVLCSDFFHKVDSEDFKVLDHVAIDRSTGGPIDGALYNEMVVNETITQEPFILKFQLIPGWEESIDTDNKTMVLKAFETTLVDICTGSLPLGGGTMRGNGVFTGTLTKTKNGKEEQLFPVR